LATTSFWKSLYLAHLSKPSAGRTVYRAILRLKARKVLELGVGTGQRAARMIEAAARFHAAEEIHYTGIDLFEARKASDGPGVSLKLAHRTLKSKAGKVRLVPGDPFAGLARVANNVGQVDLVVVSARLDQSSLEKAWFYVPRLLHENSIVLVEKTLAGGQIALEPLPRAEIAELAGTPSAGRRAA